jgi:hypothetical protein
MKRIILSASLFALSASAAWAQGATTAPTYTQPTGPAPAPTYQPPGPATAPAPAPTYGRPMAPTAAPTTAQPTGTQASGPQRDVPPYTAEVGPRQGDWEAFIGGSGTSSNEFDNNTLGVTGSIGYYVLKFLPVRLQQSFATNFGSDVNDRFEYATTGAIDFQAPLGRFQPFIGGFGGYAYGAEYSWVVGPEAGIKFYVNESTFLQGLFQYGLLADKDFEWDDGRATYSIGIGFNF